MALKGRFVFFVSRNHVSFPIPAVIEPFAAIGTFVRFDSGVRPVMRQNALVAGSGELADGTLVHPWFRLAAFRRV